MAAYDLTNNQTYLNRAVDIANFISDGWNSSTSPGGMPWNVTDAPNGANQKAACSTTLSAVALLRLAKAMRLEAVIAESYVTLALQMIEWIMENLQDPDDGLIRNSYDYENGSWTINPKKWTYNTGSLLTALSLLYEVLPIEGIRSDAINIAASAIDPTKQLYDLTVGNIDTRYWGDFTYFTHLLVEGLVVFLDVFSNANATEQIDPTLAQNISSEVTRQTQYVIDYVRDPTDDL